MNRFESKAYVFVVEVVVVVDDDNSVILSDDALLTPICSDLPPNAPPAPAVAEPSIIDDFISFGLAVATVLLLPLSKFPLYTSM